MESRKLKNKKKRVSFELSDGQKWCDVSNTGKKISGDAIKVVELFSQNDSVSAENNASSKKEESTTQIINELKNELKKTSEQLEEDRADAFKFMLQNLEERRVYEIKEQENKFIKRSLSYALLQFLPKEKMSKFLKVQMNDDLALEKNRLESKKRKFK